MDELVHVSIRRRPAVFLDRDGVIVEEVNYLHRAADIRYIPGALDTVATLNRAGIPVVVVTNQAGVGRGYYGWPDYEAVQRQIVTDLARAGGWFDGVWACGAHPDAGHPYRKPAPRMLEEAAERLALDLSRSWLVGDNRLDLEAAIGGGLQGAILVLTGHGARMRDAAEALAGVSSTRIEIAPDVNAACRRILDILGT
jgi:D-glycero-D-manno-heptose 1,7-bisphosphate phosphatase